MKDSAFMVQFENCMFASQSMHPAGNNLKGCSCSSSRSDPYLAWISFLHIKLFSTPRSPTAKTELLSIPVYSSPCFLLKIMDLENILAQFLCWSLKCIDKKIRPVDRSTAIESDDMIIRTRIQPSSAIKLGIHIIYPPQCNQLDSSCQI